uniref:Uncharacterized protein n=1 Tax=Heterorhabditis bacteriophora TaxID=37862 RepID=A0A1I7X2J2_HETBA
MNHREIVTTSTRAVSSKYPRPTPRHYKYGIS